MKINRNNLKIKGFTLVELIVVIAIIGVLASILVPNMMGYIQKAKVKQAVSDAKSVQNVLITEIASATLNPTIEKRLGDLKSASAKTGGYKIVDTDHLEDVISGDDKSVNMFIDTLGANYTGKIYDFDYNANSFEFAYTTNGMEQYKVYYNKTTPTGEEIIDEGVFTVTKK